MVEWSYVRLLKQSQNTKKVVYQRWMSSQYLWDHQQPAASTYNYYLLHVWLVEPQAYGKIK